MGPQAGNVWFNGGTDAQVRELSATTLTGEYSGRQPGVSVLSFFANCMISYAKFAKTYHAFALSRSSENTILGDLYQKPFLSRRLIPQNAHVLLHLALPDAETLALEQELRAIPKVDASLPAIDITSEIKTEADLDLPNVLKDLQATVKVSNIVSFRFEDVRQQSFPTLLRRRVDRLIDKLEDDNPAAYKHNLKKYEMAVVLFYAKTVVFKLKANTQLSAAAKAAVAAVGGSVGVNTQREEEVRYDQEDCPFAAAIVAIKDIEAA